MINNLFGLTPSLCAPIANTETTEVDQAKLEPFVDYNGPISRLKVFKDEIYIADRMGRILRLNSDSSWTTLLDITEKVKVDVIAGFLNFEFAPWFHLQPSVYVWYSSPGPVPDPNGNPSATITNISVFEVDKDTMIVDKTSEINLLSVYNPTGAHVGGELRFLSDTSLLIGLGEGAQATPVIEPQDDDSLLGKLLRYNINYWLINFHGSNNINFIMRPSFDNPKFNSPIFAKGMRNPYSTTEVCGQFLRPGPELLSYQNGDSSWEMITHVESGDNLGWPCYEGFEKTGYFPDYCKFPVKNLKTPLLVYPHSNPASPDRPRPWTKTGISISPGFIYKGTEFPSWSGSVLFGDLSNKLFYAKKDNEYVREHNGRYAMDWLPVTNLDIIPQDQMLVFVDPGIDNEPLISTYAYGSNSSSIYKLVKDN